MSDRKDGGPAFPNEHYRDAPGMTLRDYFAAKAMQGLLANPEWRSIPVAQAAAWSYEQADALLSEREGGSQ